MQNDPWILLLMFGVGAYVAKLWTDDFRAQCRGEPRVNALPGAMPASPRALIVAAAGGALVVAAETWGEHMLGLTNKQSTITALFAAYMLVAAIVEEIIFRGFIVVEKRGKMILWAGIIGASMLFAAIHPYLWRWEGGMPWAGGSLLWQGDIKAWFSTGAIFAGSLWFYFVRFASFNPTRSLLPCFVAHGTKNLGVIAIKASQGFLAGWY
jgi:membrane protease YdiL (CAAX protease family)